MTPPLVALLPSPLLGPAVWKPVEDALRRGGQPAVAVDPWPSAACGSPDDVLEGLLAVLPLGRDLILVPHSNAGLYVPSLTRERSVAAVVFVDAVLPPRSGSASVAPSGLVDLLREKADADGVLPVWTQWWDPAETSALFPDDASRRLVEREQRRLPLAYFTAEVAVAPGWDAVPAGYLGFGDTYRPEQADATARGWPVVRLPGRHLHMVTDPDSVAAELTRLLGELGGRFLPGAEC